MNVLGALQSGFKTEQILNYLSSIFPDLGPRIKEALQSGKPAEDILNYLSKFDRKQLSKLRGKSSAINPFPDVNMENPYIRGNIAVKEQSPVPESLGKLAEAGLVGAGAYGAMRGIPRIAQAVPQIMEAIPQVKETIQGLFNQESSSPKNIQSVTPTENQVISELPQFDSADILNKLGVENQVKNITKGSPSEISAYLENKVFRPEQKKLLKQLTNEPLEKIISDYQANRQSSKESLDSNINKTKGASVLLPDGQLGEIESVKQGIAQVRVGDKIRNKKIDELFESPKEAAIAALELIKSFTPEHMRSVHHVLNMYDPTTKSAQFLFHNGEGYVVEDISPDEYERLSKELDAAKTTGETKIGAWSAGAGSRGAAYQKIVKNLKKPYRKIMVGYNLFKEFQRLINEKEE